MAVDLVSAVLQLAQNFLYGLQFLGHLLIRTRVDPPTSLANGRWMVSISWKINSLTVNSNFLKLILKLPPFSCSTVCTPASLTMIISSDRSTLLPEPIERILSRAFALSKWPDLIFIIKYWTFTCVSRRRHGSRPVVRRLAEHRRPLPANCGFSYN